MATASTTGNGLTARKTYFDLNNGTGWSADPNYTIATSSIDQVNYGGKTYYFDRGIRFVDVNGDGLPDFVHSYSVSYTNCPGACPAQETYSTVMLNTGKGGRRARPIRSQDMSSAITRRAAPSRANCTTSSITSPGTARWIRTCSRPSRIPRAAARALRMATPHNRG